MIDNVPVRILINAQDKASGVFNKLKSNAGKVATAIVGYFGARFFGSAIDDAEALQTQIGTLEAIIKSTGGTAGLTAEEIVQMSKRLDEQTLGSAEGFRTASASLLTFKSVSKDAFETTLALAQDLATAGFGTLETNTIQLGKALEDPVQGLNALKRSGVSFTESQKNLIKSLVETGEKAKAQEIILKALADQVGGAGAGAGGGLSGAIDLVGKRFQDFKEQLGAGMLKPLTKANGLIADFLKKLNTTGAAKAFGDFIGNAFSYVLDKSIALYDGIVRIYDALSNSGAIQNFSDAWNNVLDTIIGLSKEVIGIIQDIYQAFDDSSALDKFRKTFLTAFYRAIELSKALWDSVKSLFTMFNDTSSTATFGDALGAVLVKLVELVNTMVSGFTTGLSVIETAFHASASVINSFLSSFVDGIAAVQEAISKITTGDLSKSFAVDAEKSRQIAESFAESMRQSNDKAAAALEKTASSAMKTRSALGDLLTSSNATSNATKNLANQQSNLANATGSVVEPMHRLELSVESVASAEDKATASSKTLSYAVNGVEKSLETANTAGITLGVTLDDVANKSDNATEKLTNYQKSLNATAAQQAHFNDVLAQEAAAQDELANAEERAANAKQQEINDKVKKLNTRTVVDFSPSAKAAYAALSPESLAELQQIVDASNKRTFASGGNFGGIDQDAIIKFLLKKQNYKPPSPSKTVNVNFRAGIKRSTATFANESDANDFIDILRTAGEVS